MTEEEYEAAMVAVQNKIAEIIEIVEPGGLSGGYVMAVKAIDPEGRDGVHIFSQPGMRSWDRLGMIHFMANEEQADSTAHSVVAHIVS